MTIDLPSWIQVFLSLGGVFIALIVFLWRTSQSVSVIVRNQVSWLEDHQDMQKQLKSLIDSHQELKQASIRVSTKLEDVEKDLLRLQGVVDHTNKIALTLAFKNHLDDRP